MVKKFRESRHTNKQTISFLIEKFIQTDLGSRLKSKFVQFSPRVKLRRRPIQANCESLDSIKLSTFWIRFTKISPKLFEICQIDQFNIKQGKIHIQTCSILLGGFPVAYKDFREHLQLM